MSEISLIPALKISSSGLSAESKRMEVIANNVANAHTTKGEDGKTFRRKQVVFASQYEDAINGALGEKKLRGVKIDEIREDTRPPKRVYRPGHPDANEDGFVHFPDINPVEEMVDMMTSSRAYEANLAAIKTAREMAQRALDIGGGG